MAVRKLPSTLLLLVVAAASSCVAQIAPVNSQSILLPSSSAASLLRNQPPLPEQCKKYECPRYNVECETTTTTDDYHVRIFNESTLWAVTNVKLDNVSSCPGSSAFWNLFQYIDGDNVENIKINMSTPVLMVYPFEKNSTTQSAHENYQHHCVMAFYIGREHWDQPPQPNHPNLVRLTWVPPHRQFVRVVGGRPDDAQVALQSASLHAVLLRNHEKIETGRHGNTFLRAQYDAPDVAEPKRRNEIIFTEFPLHRLLHVNQRRPTTSWIKPAKPTCGKK